MADVDSVPADALDALYEALTAALAGAGRDVPPGPGITHTTMTVTPGCDALGLWLDSIAVRPFGERRPSSPGDLQLMGIHHIMVMRAQLWRCVPGLDDEGAPPSFDEVTRSARELLRDAWAIQVELTRRKALSTLFPSWSAPDGAMLTTREDIGLGQATPLVPTGRMAGWQFNVELSIPAVLTADS